MIFTLFGRKNDNVWVQYGGKPFLVAPEHLRPLSPEEEQMADDGDEGEADGHATSGRSGGTPSGGDFLKAACSLCSEGSHLRS